MLIFENISAQQISWVKSNKKNLENQFGIKKLYYPETQDELKDLIMTLNNNHEQYDIIGYSSNTLFLPSYTADNVVCTKKVNSWKDTDNEFVCDCGVAIGKISKYAIEQGYIGFEGLTDLPGTVAAGIYGNCGCRGCSVNKIVESFSLLTPDNRVVELTPQQLNLKYRSTSLKRHEIQGVILQIKLLRHIGKAEELIKMAEKNHLIRKKNQPSGANNLGTTFNGGNKYTIKGLFFTMLEKTIQVFLWSSDRRKSYPKALRLVGKAKFIPYLFNPKRYMFIDEKSHILFDEYCSFLRSLYKDSRLEIEIRQ